MYRWIEEFYARLRPAMSDAEQRLLDWLVDTGGHPMVFGDCVEFAAEHELLTDDDRIKINEVLDFGVLRKAAPYFRGLIAV